MIGSRLLLALLTVSLLLTACGQKGPLTLPDKPAPPVEAGSP